MKIWKRPSILSLSEMERLHEATLYILSEKGVVFQCEEALEFFRKAGAKVERNIVYIPQILVEKSLETVPSSFELCAVNSEKSVQIGEGFAVHPAGGEVFILEGQWKRRQGSLADFADMQKLYQACKNINMTGYQPIAPADVEPGYRGLMCTYQTMLYTDKPWLAPMDYVGRKGQREILNMYEIIFGRDFMKDNYVTWNVISPESPMVYCKVACESILEFAAQRQPIVIVSAPMSGITAPVYPYAAILQQNAETLAGICLAELACPGLPILPSASLTYGNLQNATWECACPDTALMLAGAIQMYGQYYHMPVRAQTGVTSSKCLDYQAGFETMQSLILTALMGVNVVSQSVGTLDNLLTVSQEKTIIDDEIISRIRRILSGIETESENLGIDILMETAHGKDFLMHDSTLENLHNGWKTSISDWNNYEKWSSSEEKDIYRRARKHVEKILECGRNPILEKSQADKLYQYIQNI